MLQKSNDPASRLDFGHFIDRCFWFCFTAVALYCASQIREMGRSIEELNKNMAIVLYQLAESKGRADRVDSRIDKLEEFMRSRGR